MKRNFPIVLNNTVLQSGVMNLDRLARNVREGIEIAEELFTE
jgi:hypothetical protein